MPPVYIPRQTFDGLWPHRSDPGTTTMTENARMLLRRGMNLWPMANSATAALSVEVA